MTKKTSTAATVAVLEAVAAAESVDPLDLPPLYDAVDTDALESIFEAVPHGDGRAGQIGFDYHGYRVSLEYATDGTVTVEAARRAAAQ